MKSHMFYSALALALLSLALVACSGATKGATQEPDGGGTDGGSCGEPLLGSTCKKPSGACEALVCVGGSWGCPQGDLEVALTATSCVAPSDGGACGPPLVGGTCRKPSGECEALICSGASWKCPEGDTPVAVVPGSCGAVDSGTD